MAVCVAVIGKDNSPLLLRCRTNQKNDSELLYHYIVSSALDIVEERVHSSSSKAILPAPTVPTVEATRELYLGTLTAQEEYKVYGYMTNTRIKFIIVIEEYSIPMRENDIRMMFRKLHSAFCDLMSNPFITPGAQIISPGFPPPQIVANMCKIFHDSHNDREPREHSLDACEQAKVIELLISPLHKCCLRYSTHYYLND